MLRSALGLAALVVAVLLVLALVAPHGLRASSGAPSKAGGARRPGPAVSWRSGAPMGSAWLALDEVAVFLRRGAPEGAVMKRLQHLAGDRQVGLAPIAYEPTLVLRLTGGGAPSKALLAGVMQALSADRDVRGTGAVLYRGAPSASTRVVFAGDLVVRFTKRASAAAQAALLTRVGLHRVRRLAYAPRAAMYRASSPLATLDALPGLVRAGAVAAAEPVLQHHFALRAVPNDPLFGNQWNLLNSGQSGGVAGIDANLTSVWDTLRGSPEEVVAVVDEGVDMAHPDLAPNVVPGRSWDWVGNDADPSPTEEWEQHGTAVAGVAAARGFNGIGVAGAAPWAGLVAYRMLGSDSATDTSMAEALGNYHQDGSVAVWDNRDLVDVSSNSWGPEDDRHLEGPSDMVLGALQQGVTTGRHGKGTIYVWAAGNGRQFLDNINFDGYANSRYAIAVGACTNKGKLAYYSESGAPLRVVAPSEGGTLGITTTDWSGPQGYNAGDYTSKFGGTSAAAPLVSGLAALMLQANPGLGWRDVQQILMTTARKVDPADPEWTSNVAGYHISHKYGFGLVNAKAALDAARTWTPVGPETSAEATAAPGLRIPDNDRAGVTSSVTFTGTDAAVRIEYVEVYLTAPHDYWGDLEVTLIAPSGTRSVLATAAPVPPSGGNTFGYNNWRLGSARHLGESSRGTWTIRVRDLAENDTGTFQSWKIKIYGTALGADTTPPVTRVVAGSRVWWGGPVTLHLAATDLGSNVAATEFQVDGLPGDTLHRGTVVRIAASTRSHASDGRHTVSYRSIDNATPPNAEPLRSMVVSIDTRRPRVRALAAVRVRRGRTARLPFRVDDPGFNSGYASVRVRVIGPKGTIVRSILLRHQRVGRALAAGFRCRLAPGTYRYVVYATDSARNPQVRPASNLLLVR